MATILEALQSASIKLVKRRPSGFFTSNSTFELELSDLATDVARDIARSHDWQRLWRIHTLTGNGSDTEFPLPNDYDRMLIRSDLQDPVNWAWGYRRILDINQFIYETNAGILQLDPGAWILYQNALHFVPAPSSDQQAQFPYISNSIAIGPNSQPKDAFTSDQDTFFEENRLLMLGLVWRWRAENRLEFQSDYETYDKALQERVTRDKGSRIIRVTGRIPQNGDFNYAYPFPLGS